MDLSSKELYIRCRVWAAIMAILLLAIVLSLCAVVLTSRLRALRDVVTQPESGYRFPACSEIVSMRVELRGNDASARTAEDYELKSEHWSNVIAALSPSQRDPHPAKWLLIGRLEIRKRDSSTVWVDVYDLPDRPAGAFSVSATRYGKRSYYRGGNTASLMEALQHAGESKEVRS